MVRLFEMRRKRGELAAQMRKIHDAAAAENRDLNSEEQAQWDKAEGELRSLEAQIQREEKIDQLERGLNHQQERSQDGEADLRSMDDDDFAAEVMERPYSLLRAVRSMFEQKTLNGWEGEVSQEIAIRCEKKAQGFFMPMDLPFDVRAAKRAARQLGRTRAAGTLDTTAGAGAVPTVTPVNTVIELLRNKTVVINAGARLLGDLYGAFSLPRQNSATAFSWVAEGGSPTGSNLDLGNVLLKPKTGSAQTLITRRMMLQASLDVEMLAREDLVAVTGIGIDYAALAGPVATPQLGPVGLLYNTDVNPANGSTGLGANGGPLTWGDVVRMEKAIMAANANIGPMSYIMSPSVRGHVKTVEKGTAGYPIFLMDDSGEMNGYPSWVTNNAPTNLSKGTASGTLASIFMGVWDQLLIGMWGALDILVDPYTAGSSGGVKLYALQDLDIQPRHPEAFTYYNDVTPV